MIRICERLILAFRESMISARFLRVAMLLPAGLLAFLPSGSAERVPGAEPPQSVSAALEGTIVYVSDFELDIFRASPFPPRRTNPSPRPAANPASPRAAGGSAASSAPAPDASAAGQAPPSSSSPPPKPLPSPTDLDADQERLDRANELIDAMALNEVRALRTYGYEARRLRWNQPRPERGLLIRGVFSEPDDKNRARRLLFGGPSTAPKMVLYVGVNNLKNPDQPLYVLASPPSPDSRYGPVITVTPYSPAARFEIGKNPAGEEVKKIATQIAADFSALLSANSLMSTQ